MVLSLEEASTTQMVPPTYGQALPNRPSNTPAPANGNTSMDSAGVTRSSSCRLPSWLQRTALVVRANAH